MHINFSLDGVIITISLAQGILTLLAPLTVANKRHHFLSGLELHQTIIKKWRGVLYQKILNIINSSTKDFS
jgi:hypothetical protein